MQEIWKDIEDFEGQYQVSNLGNIRSQPNKANHFKTVHNIGQYNNSHGYMIVSLFKNKLQKSYQVHRLVAQAFIPNPNNYSQVNHIDGNKLNNCVNNLEWCTAKQNMQHAKQNGLRADFSGNNNPRIRKINQYDLQGNFIKQWNSIYDIINELGICRSSIWRACTGRFKQTNGYIWKYAD